MAHHGCAIAVSMPLKKIWNLIDLARNEAGAPQVFALF
jgi:hypothetical protein